MTNRSNGGRRKKTSFDLYSFVLYEIVSPLDKFYKPFTGISDDSPVICRVVVDNAGKLLDTAVLQDPDVEGAVEYCISCIKRMIERGIAPPAQFPSVAVLDFKFTNTVEMISPLFRWQPDVKPLIDSESSGSFILDPSRRRHDLSERISIVLRFFPEITFYRTNGVVPDDIANVRKIGLLQGDKLITIEFDQENFGEVYSIESAGSRWRKALLSCRGRYTAKTVDPLEYDAVPIAASYPVSLISFEKYPDELLL